MAQKRYQFKAIQLHRSAGFPTDPFGRLEGFGAGLNILYGPNGVGKTTLIRLMRSLLHRGDSGAYLEGEALLLHNGHEYTLRLEDRRLEQRDASSGDLIQLPGRNDELSDAYWLGLHDLLSAEGNNQLFAQRIRTEMQGGIDLGLAAAKNHALQSYSTPNKMVVKNERALREAFEKRLRAVAEASGLFDKLEKLKEEILQGEPLNARKALLEAAISYQGTQAQLTTVEEQLRAFDERLSLMSEATLERAQLLKDTYDEAQRAASAIEKDIEQATATIGAATFDRAWLDDQTKPKVIRAQIERIKEQVRTVGDARKKANEAQVALDSQESELSFLVDQMPEEQVLEQLLGELLQVAEESEPLRTTLAAAQEASKLLGQPTAIDVADQDRLLALKSSILDALKAGGEHTSTHFGNTRWPLVMTLAAVAATALLSLRFSAFGVVSALLATAAALLIALRGNSPTETTLSERLVERVQKNLGDLTLTDFSVASTVALLERVMMRLGEIESQKNRNEILRAAGKQVTEAQGRYDQWLADHRHSAEKIHLTNRPDLEKSRFFHAGNLLEQWLDLSQKCGTAAVALATEEVTLAHLVNQLANLCGFGAGLAIDDFLVAAESLAQQVQDLSKIHAALADKRTALREAEQGVQDALASAEQFYGRLQTSLWALDELEVLGEKYEEYRTKSDERRRFSTDLKRFEEDAVHLARDVEPHVLEEELTDLTEELRLITEKHQELGEVREQYRQAIKDDALERDEATWRDAQASLAALREEEVKGRFIAELVALIDQESKSHHQPEILKRASAWMQRITHHTYLLGIGDEGFVAIASDTKRTYGLDQLSSGTRVQLLFAIRMAFLEHLERGSEYHFPLFFDELMANSDDERSLAIAQAIGEIVTDRQVFYATAQADEVGKLKEVIGSDVQIFDLAARASGEKQRARPFKAVSIPTIEVPNPVDDYDAYAKALGVAAPDLFAPIGEMHSWYLLNDSEALHQLLRRNITTAGRAALANPALQTRLKMLEAVQTLSQRGRPRPISRYDLVDLPKRVNRNANYFEAILQFLDDGEKDGNDLAVALEERQIKNIPDLGRIDFLDWLHEEGWANDEERYTPQQILEHLAPKFPDLTVDDEEYLVIQRYLSSLPN